MAFRVRSFTETDAEAVIELVRQLQTHEAQYFDRMKPPGDIGIWYVREMQDACAAHAGAFLVAEADGRVIGYAVLLMEMTSSEHPDEVLYRYALVADLAVERTMRRQGVGQHLLSECERLARVAGVPWLRIAALAGNAAALGAYEKFGFGKLLVTMEKPLA
jgi:GNAT superfamily N-acetyltransferase